MTILSVLAGGAAIAGAAVAVLWLRGSPGKRLRFGAGNLYYTPAVTIDEAKRVGDHLVGRGIFGDTRLDALLTRNGPTYQLQLINSLGHSDEEQDLACELLAGALSEDRFDGAPVEVHVCDRILRPTSVLPHTGRFGRRLKKNAAQLFYRGAVTEAEAQSVADFLAGAGLFNDQPKVAQMDRVGDRYEFRLAVDVDPDTPDLLEGAAGMARDLSRHALDGAKVDVRYCRKLAGTLRSDDTRG